MNAEFLQVLQSAKLSEHLVAHKTFMENKQQPSSYRVPSRLHKQQLSSHCDDDTYESLPKTTKFRHPPAAASLKKKEKTLFWTTLQAKEATSRPLVIKQH